MDLKPSATEFVPRGASVGRESGGSNSARAPQHASGSGFGRSEGDDMLLSEHGRLKFSACAPLPPRRTLVGHSLPPELRLAFAQRLRLTLARLPLQDARNKEVPKWYTHVMPLDAPEKSQGEMRGAAGSSGYPSSVFKVLSKNDGFVYALRRVDNVRNLKALQQQCHQAQQLWKRVRHPNVVPLRDAFLHQGAVFLVHDYWPGAKTVAEYVNARRGEPLGEHAVLSIAIQLLAGLQAVHHVELSFRGSLIPEQILLTGRNRVRIGNAGLMHVLEGITTEAHAYIFEDVRAVAKILLAFCCMSLDVVKNWEDSLEFVASRYSGEMVHAIERPLRGKCNAEDMLALCQEACVRELNQMYSHSDALEEHLCKQLETHRINQLLLKINLITERPEFGKSEATSWAETGDRYIIKLFRDYVFHQTTDEGKPWLDVGHIMTCLNKLDVGLMEKILLPSRDGRSMLVVTFADVRRCLDEAFQELIEGHRSSEYYQLKKQGRGAPDRPIPPQVAMAMQQQQLSMYRHHQQAPRHPQQRRSPELFIPSQQQQQQQQQHHHGKMHIPRNYP